MPPTLDDRSGTEARESRHEGLRPSQRQEASLRQAEEPISGTARLEETALH